MASECCYRRPHEFQLSVGDSMHVHDARGAATDYKSEMEVKE